MLDSHCIEDQLIDAQDIEIISGGEKCVYVPNYLD